MAPAPSSPARDAARRAVLGSPGAASSATENYLDDTLNVSLRTTQLLVSPQKSKGHSRSISAPPRRLPSLSGECSICLNNLKDEACASCEAKGEPASACRVATGKCRHSFHRHCLLEWLSTCDTDAREMVCPLDKGPWEWT